MSITTLINIKQTGMQLVNHKIIEIQHSQERDSAAITNRTKGNKNESLLERQYSTAFGKLLTLTLLQFTELCMTSSMQQLHK
jgi:hypothetical protein